MASVIREKKEGGRSPCLGGAERLNSIHILFPVELTARAPKNGAILAEFRMCPFWVNCGLSGFRGDDSEMLQNAHCPKGGDKIRKIGQCHHQGREKIAKSSLRLWPTGSAALFFSGQCDHTHSKSASLL